MINHSNYLGEASQLKYQSLDELVKNKGNKDCALMKRDLSRAFRQFPGDPGDYNLLGWLCKSVKYFDKAHSMGMNISPYLYQSVTDAVRYIYQDRGFNLVNYLDDLATAEIWDKAQEVDGELGKVIEESGLQ